MWGWDQGSRPPAPASSNLVMAKFEVQFPWPRARHGRMWQALSPGVPVQTSSRGWVPSLGSLPTSTKASCFMPKSPRTESDTKYTFPLG